MAITPLGTVLEALQEYFEYKHLESMRDELQGMTWVSWRGWLMDLGNPKCAPLSLGRLPLR